MRKAISNNLLLAVSFVVLTVLAVLLVHGFTDMALVLLACFCVLFAVDVIVFWPSGKIKAKWMRGVVTGFLILLNLVVCLSVSIGQVATALWFSPCQDTDAYHTLSSLSNMREVTIRDGGRTYSGWFVKNAEGKAPLVLFFGGNGDCAAQICASFQKSAYWDTYAGYNFMMVDYPGYGLSGGSPSESSIFQMTLAAYDYAVTRDDVDGAKIVVEGYSLGTGAATYLASRRSVSGLILIAPFDQALSMYNAALPIFYGPFQWLASIHFNSMAYAQSVSVHPLVITSTSDEYINYRLSEHLAEFFPEKPEFHLLSGLHHNDYLGGDATGVRQLVSAYLQEALQ